MFTDIEFTINVVSSFINCIEQGIPQIYKRVLLTALLINLGFYAERVGFEPTEDIYTFAGFLDQIHKPLGHLSIIDRIRF